MSELIVRITGTAGQGVISAGDIFSLSVEDMVFMLPLIVLSQLK